MERLSMCRICFVENDLMHSVYNTNLQGTYERLTGTPFVTNDCRPLQVCYICFARLRNCYQLQTSCLHSEQIFTQILENTPLRLLSSQNMRTIQIEHPLINISIKPADLNDSDVIVIDSDDHSELPLDVTVHVKVEAIDTDQEVNKEYDQTNYFQGYNDISTEENSELEYNIKTVEAKDNIDYQCAEVNIENKIDMEDSIKATEFSIEPEHSISNAEIDKKDDIGRQHCVQRNKKINVVNNVTNRNIQTAVVSINNNVEKQHRIRMDSLDNASLKDVKVVLYKMELESNKTKDLNLENENKKIEKKHEQKRRGAHVLKKPTSILKENSRTNLRKVENNVKFHLTQNILKDRDKTYNPRNTYRPDKKLYKCDICEKRFYRKHHLIEHNRKHTGEKPYKCNICEKAFTFHNVLNNHIRIHSDEKPHKCNVCEKCFNLKINLMRHIRIHTNEKPYKCSVCEKCFNCKQHLKIHMRIHTGEKPYKCDICSKCFNQKNNLNIHIRSVHTVEKSCK